MLRKRILVVLRAKDIVKTKKKNSAIWRWVEDCRANYDIKFWGRDLSIDGTFSLWGKAYTERDMLSDLKKKIDVFKPDFMYLTLRKEYETWLPNLTGIAVPKIYVEVDSQYYSVKDPWYNQFDILKCREPSFNGWDKIPLFRWSVPEKAFPSAARMKKPKNHIYFVGQRRADIYPTRVKLKKIFYRQIRFTKDKYNKRYWEILQQASCLVCPTESVFGDFTPAKLFEFLASGSAVLTNCDFKLAGIPELKSFAIKYNKLDTVGIADMRIKLAMDFTPYHNKAIEAMREHTHRIRYKELFG